ncbi:MAG: DUF6249 domain-containing protein [Steroidobacteraceae bacterium]
MDYNAVAIVAMMIPIVAIILIFGTIMLRVWAEYRNKREMFQMYHAERLAAIEKGIDLPPLPPEFFTNHRRGLAAPAYHLRSGLVLLLIGAALCVALYTSAGPDNAWWGLLPAAVGAGNLLFYALAGRKLEAQDGGSDHGPSAGASDRTGDSSSRR